MSVAEVCLLSDHPIDLTPDELRLPAVLQSPYLYEENLVYYIDSDGRGQSINYMGEWVRHMDKTIKIEGYEKFSPRLRATCLSLGQYFDHDGPVTAHVFMAEANSVSFPTHTDPDDVVIYTVTGQKTMVVEDQLWTINPGEALYIPAHTPHRATNATAAVTISFGLERYLLEKLNEDYLRQDY